MEVPRRPDQVRPELGQILIVIRKCALIGSLGVEIRSMDRGGVNRRKRLWGFDLRNVTDIGRI